MSTLLRANLSHSRLAVRSTAGQPSNGSVCLPACSRLRVQPRRISCRSSEDGPGEDISALKADLERYQARAAATSTTTTSNSNNGSNPSSSSQDAAAGSSPKDLLDKLLIADFFLVLGSLGWLGAGLGLKGATGSSALLDAWFPLWQLLWQPAIGVLMAGALVSGGLGWIKEQQQK